jgi:23S rRNA A2030 N6-methylase RlmJ
VREPVDPSASIVLHLTRRALIRKELLRGYNSLRVIEKHNKESVPLSVHSYLELLRKYNEECSIREDNENIMFRLYPGSPLITQIGLRPHDEHVLFELSQSHFQDLKLFLKDSKAKIYCQNGLSKAPDVIKHDNGKPYLCIIDPPYEAEHECAEVLEALQRILEVGLLTTIMIWIPIFLEIRREIAELQTILPL